MKPQFTPDGVEVQTYQEIYDELAAGYRDIYGEDINLDPDSPDGQRIGIEAQARLDLQSFGLLLYQQIDPDFSLGQRLNSLIKLSGITRRPAARSQVDVTITTDRALTLPKDYAVEDDLGQAWITLSEIDLVSGENTVTLFAEEFGAVEADAGTITEQATFVIGVESVTNPDAATVGRDEETDEELRIRRNRSLETPRSSSTGRLFTALADLLNVTDVVVYENDTDVTDSRGIPAHSLWVVIEGGAVDNIVETMVKNKTGGKPMIGAISGTYDEAVIRPDGSVFTIVHEMYFDRPTMVDIHVRLNATRKEDDSIIDEGLIASEIAKKTFVIGENLLAADLYRYAFNAGNCFIPTNLEISADGGATWTDGRLVSALDEKYTIDAGNVTVTEVIP